MKNLHTIKLKAQERKVTGKKARKKLDEDVLPAVIYDNKTNSTPIKVNYGDIYAVLKEITKTSVIQLNLDGTEKYALVKEIQKDPVQGTLKHVSLFEIKEGQEMTFEIPIVTKGIAPAVKNNLGILVTILDSIKVRCKPEELISQILVDVTELEKPGDKIRLNEIDLPESLELLHKEDIDKTIITITNLQKLKLVEEEEEEKEDELEGEEGEGIEGEEGVEGAEDEEGATEAEGTKEKGGLAQEVSAQQ